MNTKAVGTSDSRLGETASRVAFLPGQKLPVRALFKALFAAEVATGRRKSGKYLLHVSDAIHFYQRIAGHAAVGRYRGPDGWFAAEFTFVDFVHCFVII